LIVIVLVATGVDHVIQDGRTTENFAPGPNAPVK
jgi:hypothetical protein